MVAGILVGITPSTSASNCPETWNIKVPRLLIATEMREVALDGAPKKLNNFYVSTIATLNFGTSGFIFDTKSERVRKLLPYIKNNLGSDFLLKLEASTSQVLIRDGFVPAEFNSLNTLNKDSDGPQTTNFFFPDFPDRDTPYNFLRLGNLFSGSEVRYLVEITMRGCDAPFLISSNVATIPESNFQETGWSQWVQETESWLKSNYEEKGRPVNWIAWDKNISLFKNGLEEVKKGSIESSFGWNETSYSRNEFRPVVGDNYAIPSIHGFSPVNCARSSQYSQLPVSLIVDKVPCKVVVGSTFTGYSPSQTATSPFIEVFEIDNSAAELKAKQEAEAQAQAAAELKAKQEAEAKTAAELKAKQEAEAKAAAELKAKQESEAKAVAELKAKQELEARIAADLKAKQEAETKAAATRKTTITCVKGKLIKKVTAVKPKCPTGYKLKK